MLRPRTANHAKQPRQHSAEVQGVTQPRRPYVLADLVERQKDMVGDLGVRDMAAHVPTNSAKLLITLTCKEWRVKLIPQPKEMAPNIVWIMTFRLQQSNSA